MSREGQQRVQVRPGVWLWLDENDRKRYQAAESGETPADTSDKIVEFGTKGIETASVEASERAVQPRGRARRK